MAKTANAYVSDLGEVEVTISSGNVSAVSGLTTAEAIVIDGAVRSFMRTNTPQKAVSRMNVIGDVTPIVTRSGRVQEEELWELVLVDDYFSGAAGEWGTDTLSATEIFMLLSDNDEDPGGLKATPAGGTAAHIEITLTNPKLLGYDLPKVDADSVDPEVVKIYFACSGHTRAAHG